ncbi:deleted in malignant brain tumors 1 protein-like isoform X1 [Alligator sinensis]|uniref:Soluble scavenger receptor cysteine-rich domain-containing protein SSC5D n=1 Tax=Alligator sinensis TaxID=38654 RepID=A0A1U8DBE7_ALLSI|nr:deleted in malignant brain tumors 1 protein-like isoform X1 [Alligator sinensis]
MEISGCLLGRSLAACTGGRTTRIPVLLAWLSVSIPGFLVPGSATPGPAEIRLVNGPSHCAGRVEVFYNNTWGTVCDDTWDLTEAYVVCRQLGCGTALSAPRGSRYGAGSDRIWLDEVNCTGTESALSECSADPWGKHNCNHIEDASVVCSGSDTPERGPLQLVDGPNSCAGRVEVLHDHQWGTVCDDGWDLTDAGVVCKQLGCGTAVSAPGKAYFGRGHERIWLDEVNCTGLEAALSDCQASSWGKNNCYHGEDASVVCSASNSFDPVAIQLANGTNRCAGRVEVLYNNTWGTICDESWDLTEAQVVCTQLDCGTAVSAPGRAHFGEASDHIWLKKVNCTGTETSLSLCRTTVLEDSSCTHKKDASVVCGGSVPPALAQVRLVKSSSRCAGRVEVFHDGQWGTVCDDDWDLNDAGIVCRQLGCGTAVSAPHKAHFGLGSGPVWLDDINCVGTEAALSECKAKPWGQNDCSHAEDASVVCSDLDIDLASVRLVNGHTRCAGRVEVLHDHQWGTVCDDNWDLKDAGVVCRQLGCGTAVSAPGGAQFGRGSTRVWLDDVNCIGTETSLTQCNARSWGVHNCHHGEDAGVVCSDTTIPEPVHLRLLNGSNRCTGRVEVLHDKQWGTVCDNSWDLTDAEVVCKQLGCGTALSAPLEAHFGEGSEHIWLDDVNCNGTETALTECKARPWGNNSCHHGKDAGVVCSDGAIPATKELQLMNGQNRCAGRVEVFHNNQWGTVCDDSWDLKDAGVVCRQLGCGTAVSAPGGARFGRGSNRIWLDDVNCQGTEETLTECRAKRWGNHNCNHGEDAGVVCSGAEIPTSEVLRLVNGLGRCSGTVEVFHDNQWGTVCDDSWDLRDAGVVCRQLGCGTAVLAPGGARFGRGSNRIWLDDVNCQGTEEALTECRARPWGIHNCNNGEAAGVVCSDGAVMGSGKVRVVNGTSRCSGRVEVFHNQQWGTVCDDSWDLRDAAVVCRQLGCGTAESAPGGARFGRGPDPIWLDEVNCVGIETALSECRAGPWGTHNCNHGEDAGVVCSGGAIPVTVELRLVQGPNHCSGRVEVFHNQQWGTVCDDTWDLRDAAVVCRQLGCGTAESALGGARFGRGPDPIWLDEVNCAGTETALSECRARPWGTHNCNHGEDAGVVCSGRNIPVSAELQLVNGPSRCAGRVEVLHDHEWGTVCDDGWDQKDATVVCRQLNCGKAVSTQGANFGRGSDRIWLDDVNCTGTEATLSECRARSWGDHNCHHGEDVGVVCSGPPPLLLKLVDGPTPCSGRVEVMYNGTWGSVCDSGWGLPEATVVCKQLGCGTAQSAPGGAQFGLGTGHIWLENMNCTGTESLAIECQYRPLGLGLCIQGSTAGVVCARQTSSGLLCSALIGLVVILALLCSILLYLKIKQNGTIGNPLDHVHLKELGNMGLAAQAQGATYLTAKLGHNGEVDSETAQLVREDTAH